MSLIEFEESNEYSAALKVVGVGGGGTNAVNSMVRNQIMGVEFIVANTDIQSLESSSCTHKVQLGSDLTRGLGAGSSPGWLTSLADACMAATFCGMLAGQDGIACGRSSSVAIRRGFAIRLIGHLVENFIIRVLPISGNFG